MLAMLFKNRSFDADINKEKNPGVHLEIWRHIFLTQGSSWGPYGLNGNFRPPQIMRTSACDE
jgi:hypothetical protein